VAIACHDANILLRHGLAPAGGSGRKVRFDFGAGVAEVRRYYAKLEAGMRCACGGLARTGHTFKQQIDVARLGNRQREARNFSSHDFSSSCLALRAWPIYH
jgi:hypothetical protein